MRYLLKASGIAAATSFAAFAPGAVAQENTFTLTCQDIGSSRRAEPLGDREGHSISVSQFSCRVNSGPMSGGVYTGSGYFGMERAERRIGFGQRRRPQTGRH